MFRRNRFLQFGIVAAAFALCAGNALAQGIVGKKAGKKADDPMVEPGVPPAPVGGIAVGLQSSGQVINMGIGDQVSNWARQGIHGQDLAARIHEILRNRPGQGGGGPGKGGGGPGQGGGGPGQGGKPGGVGGGPGQGGKPGGVGGGKPVGVGGGKPGGVGGGKPGGGRLGR